MLKNNLNKEIVKTNDWIYFNVSDIFSIEIAISVDKSNLFEDKNGINYITRKSTNNGLEYKVQKVDELINIGNCLTLTMVGANKGTCFYQKENFMSSQNMLILRNNYLTNNIAFFLIPCLEKKYRISSDYNAIQKNLVQKDLLLLPAVLNNNTYEPDWNFMENYIQNIKNNINYNIFEKNINSLRETKKIIQNLNGWKDYQLCNLFDIKGSKTTPKNILEKKGIGIYPYITTTAENQGVSGYYDYFTEEGNVLTFDSAVLGTCFYQEKNFSASDHVELGIPKYRFNKKIGLFLQTIINKTNEGIYHYGHKANQKRIRETIIKLPSIFNNKINEYEPDWDYIENYIQNIEEEIFK